MKSRNIFCLMILSASLVAQNDIPLESWRTHFSYRDAKSIGLTKTGAFCAGANSLFFLDLPDQSLNRISKIDGLSDTEISTIAYYDPLKMLVIAYRNGNIDLLKDNLITNINTIKITPITQPKTISHITFKNNIAYLSSDFGVVVLDLIKNEVMEAYTNIGENGEVISINFGTVFLDTLFLATEQGVIGGSLDPSVNLQDYKNWKRFNSLAGIPKLPVSTIGSTKSQLLATVGTEGIYFYQGGSWDRIDYDLESPVLHMDSGSGPSLLTTEYKILSISDLKVEDLANPVYPKPQSSAMNSDGLWVADSVNGLVFPRSGELISQFPSGPFSDSVFLVFNQENTIIALPPGYDAVRNPLRSTLGFYLFEEGEWTSYNSSNSSKTEFFPAIADLVDVAYNRQNKKYYFASFGEGIIEWDPEGEVRILDESTPGSTLINIIPGGRNVFVSSIYSDNPDAVWATNFGNPASIHKFNPTDETWMAYNASFQAGRFPLDLLIAANDDLWLRLDANNGGGIMVFNPESSLQKHLTDIEDQGGLPSRNVNDLAIDKNGQVWVGTDKGITHYPFPFDILENPAVNASPVLIDGRPLLRDEPINCISVDGGNQKWIGTDNGIWLFTAQGDRVLYHFTLENSPLPSNKILDIEVNDLSGEVFIVTDLGTVSFRGTSTEGLPEHSQVRIFPNPVTRDFSGLVGISGLVNNAIVKVADITGKLVNEFKAAGGTAVWDIRDFQGRRVQSGVYLVFSSSPDGNETFIGKIAVIN